MSSRARQLLLATAIFVGFALLALLYYVLFLYGKETTDDSYVHGNRVILNAQVSANCQAFYTDNNEYVEEGQLLVSLDDTNYRLELSALLEELAWTTRQVKSLEQEVLSLAASLEKIEIEEEKALYDYENRFHLQDMQAVSDQEVEHTRLNWLALSLQKESVLHTLAAKKALLGTTPLEEHPSILEKKEQLRKAYVALKRCQIYAPTSGFCALRRIQVGEAVFPNKELLSLVPIEQMWVEANFKETQLKDIRVGQTAHVEVDAFGRGALFVGTVQGIQMGSGSAFSIIPAQNATGNWIKIVQRVPVRIALQKQDLLNHPLRIGLSCYTKVYTSDVSGSTLQPQKPVKAVETTDVLHVNLDPINQLMEELIRYQLGENEVTTTENAGN